MKCSNMNCNSSDLPSSGLNAGCFLMFSNNNFFWDLWDFICKTKKSRMDTIPTNPHLKEFTKKNRILPYYKLYPKYFFTVQESPISQ